MKKTIVQFTRAVSLFFALSGCTAISNWADSAGEHMPVIGERCENWQCFTSSGQSASDAKKKQMQQPAEQQKTAAQNPSQTPPANTSATSATPTPTHSSTPDYFDMSPEELAVQRH